ncbi:MAG: Flp pilus assembly protein CpaB [Coriobacteriaceae bacterium]|nr:Flp pilus assembly protein CpaB [Coriobacteriaceae bacterium]
MTTQRKQLIIAIAAGLVAVIAVFAYTASINNEARTARNAALEHYGGEQVSVLVANQDISAGTTLDSANVTSADWLVDLLPQGEVATDFLEVDGLVAQEDIKGNEPLLLDRIGYGTARISVPDGLEAVSVSSDDVLAVGGAISAGSFVDVYVETSQGEIVLLGEDILVLETNTSQTEDEDDEQVAWVTLAVTGDSVSELISASSKGTVHFVLPGNKGSEEGA